MKGVKVTGIRIRDYRGIEEVALPVGPHGAVMKGPNGAGKTSLLNAIKCALEAQDIGPDAIRHGANRCEILIDLSAAQVKRVITASGSQLSVTPTGEAGAAGPVRSPQKWLNELLGGSSLDPIEFFRQNAKERRAIVMRALPVRIDRERLRKEVPSWATEANPNLATYLTKNDPGGRHALEVCAELTDMFYKWRTAVNSDVKAAEATHKGELAQLDALRTKLPADAIDLTVANEDRAARAADTAYAELIARRERIARVREKTAGTRARIEKLRVDANEIETRTPLVSAGAWQSNRAELAATESTIGEASEVVTQARRALDAAEARLSQLRATADSIREAAAGLTDQDAAHETNRQQAAALRQQAADLEASMGAVEEMPVDGDDLARAGAAQAQVHERLELARIAEAFREQTKKTDEKEAAVSLERARADRLTTMVDRFRDTLPRELLKESASIPGLAFDGDDITLDGTGVDKLCGKEQLTFAVELARRANAKSRLIIVDGLERLDPDQYETFIHAATKDEYQVIATRVDRGDVVLEAISLEGGAE